MDPISIAWAIAFGAVPAVVGGVVAILVYFWLSDARDDPTRPPPLPRKELKRPASANRIVTNDDHKAYLAEQEESKKHALS